MEKKNFNKDFFAKVLSQEISKKENEEFHLWFSMSEKNRSEFQQYKKIWELAPYVKQRDLNSAKIKTEVKIFQKLKTQRNFFTYLQKVAAVLFIPVLIASIYFYTQKAEPESQFETVETVKTPYGARTSLQLPDGSLVWLNAGGEISFPHNFNNKKEIELDGEMYLEVKKDTKPFIVKTQYGNIEVLGTKFNVTAFENEPFKTTLIEGSVAITGEELGTEIKLEPGFQALINNGEIEINQVDVLDFISWKDGKMEFRREPFELVAKRLERWFNVTIELQGEEIKNLWYTGTIEMETFNEVLELIKNTTPIEYSFNSKTRILTIKSNLNK